MVVLRLSPVINLHARTQQRLGEKKEKIGFPFLYSLKSAGLFQVVSPVFLL